MGQAKNRKTEINALKNTTTWAIIFNPFSEYAENKRVLTEFFDALVPELKAHAHVGKTAIEGIVRAVLKLDVPQEQAVHALHGVRQLMHDAFSCPAEVCVDCIWMARLERIEGAVPPMNDAELITMTRGLNAPRLTPLQ